MPQKIQRCAHCDNATGRCEEDSLYITDDDGPLCEPCYDALMIIAERKAEEQTLFNNQS
jgi:hypothetical protein